MAKKQKQQTHSKNENNVKETTVNIKQATENLPINRDSETEQLIKKLAPESIELGYTDYIKIDGRYARTWKIDRIPNQVYIGWLRAVYEDDKDTDISAYMVPAKPEKLRKDLLQKRTTLKAEIEMDVQSDRANEIDSLQHKLDDIQEQLDRIERSGEVGYFVRFLITLYSDKSKEMLDKNSRELENKFSQQGVTLRRLTLQQYQAWLSNLPFGRDHLDSKMRNFSAGAAMTSFPFYSADKTDKGGVYIGDNLLTNRPITLNVYDRGSGVSDSNINIIGSIGSGKTFLVSALTLRSALNGIRTLIIDPEGEYKKVTDAIHGDIVRISVDGTQSQMMNIFDLEEEKVTDEFGKESEKLSLADKIEDVADFISVADKDINQQQLASIKMLTKELYESAPFSIVDGNPESLYHHDDRQYDETKKAIVLNKYKKRMPKLSDFLDLMQEHVYDGTHTELKPVLDVMQPYRAGGPNGAFDTYTPDSLKNLRDALVIDMDISQVENNHLRSLALYVVLSWAWEKFGKKHPERRKRIAVDEAWMFTSKSFPGHQYSASFLENVARRFRKQNGGLLVATQNVDEFVNDPSGQQVIKQGGTTFLFNQNSAGIGSLEATLKIDNGIFAFVKNSQPGQFVLLQGNQNFVGMVRAFPWEEELIKKSAVGNGAASKDSTRN